jgi:hypothetical protein
MKARVSISAKILLLSFLNVLLLGLVFAAFVRIQYRFDLSSLLLSPGRDRILAVSRLIALQLPNTDRENWDQLLAAYTPMTHASACLFDGQGTQQAGPSVMLPQGVLQMIRHEQGPPLEPPGRGPADGTWQSLVGPGSVTVIVLQAQSPAAALGNFLLTAHRRHRHFLRS